MKIKSDDLAGHGPIKMLYPGNALTGNDSGMGSIGRIDYALFNGAHVIPMHPHVNDEILTYLRTGNVEHKDSEGITASLNNTKLMLMKAGKRFYHEEAILDSEGPLEALQIFIRPQTKDLNPEVSFHELDAPYSVDEWRLIASPDQQAHLQFTSQTWIYDIRASEGRTFRLPNTMMDDRDLKYLLFVFHGKVNINHEILDKKDSLIFDERNTEISCLAESDLVLFVTDVNAEIFKEGMFSGNIH